MKSIRCCKKWVVHTGKSQRNDSLISRQPLSADGPHELSKERSICPYR